MEASKILDADVLDIIFDGKNKEYGAYQLRKDYDKRLFTAILVMSVTCLLLFLGSILANDNNKNKSLITVEEVKFENLKEPKKPQPLPAPITPKQPPKVEVAKFTPPKIVIDLEVTPDDELREIQELEDIKVGTINVEGMRNDDFVAPPVEKSTGIIEGPKVVKQNFEGVFTKVEKEAAFPGGAEGWRKYLERNLNADVAADNGAPAGNYTVQVQFIVDKEGNISNVIAIEVPPACIACGPEAVKVIKRGPRWEPAVQNGSKVMYQAIQMITFQVAEE